jgi:hypothetical protein
MIKGIWDMIEVYCGDKHKHGDDCDKLPKLEIVQGVYNGYFYNCPKYRDDRREPGELKCHNRISPVEYEKMIDHISNLLEEAEMNNEKINLVGHTWKSHGIKFEIFDHTENKIKVTMLNPKEVQ